MIHKVPEAKVYISKHDWLTSKFLFSFADYFDQDNMSWGKLRVWNDDTIAFESGFPMHSHKNFEIVTIVFEGELTHSDSLGNERVLHRGFIQHMSAGTGITHSEYNNTKHPLSLFQIWIAPDKLNIQPNYQEKEIGFGTRGLHTLIDSTPHFESEPNLSLSINANAKIFYGHFLEGETIHHKLEKHEYTLIYIRSGHLNISHHDFKAGDQARINEETSLFIQAKEDTEFVMVTTW